MVWQSWGMLLQIRFSYTCAMHDSFCGSSLMASTTSGLFAEQSETGKAGCLLAIMVWLSVTRGCVCSNDLSSLHSRHNFQYCRCVYWGLVTKKRLLHIVVFPTNQGCHSLVGTWNCEIDSCPALLGTFSYKAESSTGEEREAATAMYFHLCFTM